MNELETSLDTSLSTKEMTLVQLCKVWSLSVTYLLQTSCVTRRPWLFDSLTLKSCHVSHVTWSTPPLPSKLDSWRHQSDCLSVRMRRVTWPVSLYRGGSVPIWPILCWWDVKPYSINHYTGGRGSVTTRICSPRTSFAHSVKFHYRLYGAAVHSTENIHTVKHFLYRARLAFCDIISTLSRMPVSVL